MPSVSVVPGRRLDSDRNATATAQGIVMRKEEMKFIAKAVIPAGLLMGAVLLSGCGGEGPDQDKADETPTSTYSPPVGAIRDLTDVECKPDSQGVWSVKAKISNSSKERQTYEVAAAVIKSETSEVFGKKDFVVTLEPGKSHVIRGSHIYKGAAKSGQCVPVVTLKP